jgi:hypothetical protein
LVSAASSPVLAGGPRKNIGNNSSLSTRMCPRMSLQRGVEGLAQGLGRIEPRGAMCAAAGQCDR